MGGCQQPWRLASQIYVYNMYVYNMYVCIVDVCILLTVYIICMYMMYTMYMCVSGRERGSLDGSYSVHSSRIGAEMLKC